MNKLIYFFLLVLYCSSIQAIEKTKEEKVAKYVLEKIQKDYSSCYAFYRITNEIFKKANAEKSVIEGLEKSADVTLKFTYDLGEVLNYKPKIMAENNKKKIKKFSTIAKKNFNQLAIKYGKLCKSLVENQKQRIDYWENKGNNKIK